VVEVLVAPLVLVILVVHHTLVLMVDQERQVDLDLVVVKTDLIMDLLVLVVVVLQAVILVRMVHQVQVMLVMVVVAQVVLVVVVPLQEILNMEEVVVLVSHSLQHS
jgi:hypothetical protein